MPTRTILFHITMPQQVVFYLLAALSLAVCFWGLWRRVPLWRAGKPLPPVKNWPQRVKNVLDQTLAQRRVRRRRFAGGIHAAIFFGFLALFIGTVIVAIEHYGALVFGEHWFYKGTFYLLTKTLLDLFGVGLLVGVVLALVRRATARPESLGHSAYDAGFLSLVLVATITGFLLEGAGIAADATRLPYAAFTPVGLIISKSVPFSYAVIWWVHVVLVLAVIAVLPFGRRRHLLVIPLTVALQPERPMGVLEPLTLAEVEKTGKVGLAELGDLDFWQRLSLDGCMECGRCTDVCPANAVGKELDPKRVVLELRDGGVHLSTDLISEDSLWACTNCHACVQECPALIRHVDLIDGIRRHRVAEGRLSGSGAGMLRKLGSRENPWGLPASQRLDWAKGLTVEKATPDDGREVLFWVGCSGAFEPRAQKTVQAIAQLLEKAGVKFTVLGPKERCTGDAARRMGDEFLFQQLAEANISTLNGIGAKKIITQCPHCLHTLKNEYGQFGGNYEVQHHTQFLAELVAQGRLTLENPGTESVTYHDPCFLARVNQETEAPRKALGAALQLPMLEPERHKEKTFCCGAGGGRMWMEEPPHQRPGYARATELLATGAKTVAVGCPFCKVMIADSVAAVAGENPPEVLDVAELMLRATKKREEERKDNDNV